MIEILISLAFIAFILSALLSYQISAEKSDYQNFLHSIATIQLSNFSEMLLAATSNNARQNALLHWNTDNHALLPQGIGNFSEINTHDCKITLRWFSGKREIQSIESFC